MYDICRLCREKHHLKNSHLIPKFVFKYLKECSITGRFRNPNNPNIPCQDGIKLPFLCHDCEEKFSKYERYFYQDIFKEIESKESFKIDVAKMKYFILSVSWRVLQSDLEKIINNTSKLIKGIPDFTKKEKEALIEVAENWRIALLEENHNVISQFTMYFIPLKEAQYFKTYSEEIWNNIEGDFKAFGEEDKFTFAVVYLKLPYLILLCNIWGDNEELQQFNIVPISRTVNFELPACIKKIMMTHKIQFAEGKRNISQKQIENIRKRAFIDDLQ